MNTKLPPLPANFISKHTDIWERIQAIDSDDFATSLAVEEAIIKAVRDYGEQCARAAVEAERADRASSRQQSPGSYVNWADIRGSDAPHVVVEKLDAAFHKAMLFATPPAAEARVPDGFTDWLKSRESDSYSCGLLVRDALDRLSAAPAAPQAEPTEFQWPKLSEPAQVGGAIFRPGVSTELVVKAALRNYLLCEEEKGWTPEQRAEQEKAIADFRKLIEESQKPHHTLRTDATQPPTQQASAQGEQAQQASAQPTKAAKDVLDCPFCGSTDVSMVDDLITFHGQCGGCGATSSVSSYRNGAIQAWNRRASNTGQEKS